MRSTEPEGSTGFAYAALTVTAFFLASNHIIGRGVHESIPPIGLSFWRWTVGALVFMPFALPRMRQSWPLLRPHLGVVALLSLFMVGGTTLVLIALTRTFAINVSLINAVQPTLTVFFAWLLYREALNGRRAIGVLLGFAGVAVMVSRADLGVLLHLDFSAGDFIALLAMCGFAGYGLNLRRLPRELGVVVALFSICVTGVLMLLPFYLWESLTVRPVPVTSGSVAAILALAVLVVVLGNLGWYTGNRIIGPSRASMFINLIPVFGSVLAIAFLGERLLFYHLTGGAMVIAGLVLAGGAGRRPAPANPTGADAPDNRNSSDSSRV